jgi:hypothetical protein
MALSHEIVRVTDLLDHPELLGNKDDEKLFLDPIVIQVRRETVLRVHLSD